MRTIDVKYIDTKHYKVRIHQDELYQDFEQFTDLFSIHTHKCDLATDDNAKDYLFTENGVLRPSIQMKMKAGKLYPITVTDWGGGHLSYKLASDLDYYNVNGYIQMNYDKSSYEQFRELLETYTDWANGNVYYVTIETEDGLDIDSCGGLVGDEAVKQYIREQLPNAIPDNVDIKGVYSGYSYAPSEYETSISL